MKRKKISELITVTVFIIVLLLPGAIMGINSVFHIEIGKNRHKITAQPVLTVSNISAYPEMYESWINNNHPFHDDLKTVWTKINYHLFRNSGSAGVVVGKTNGEDKETWLFYSDDTDQNPIKDAQGVSTFKNSVKNCMVNNASKYTKLLEDKGISAYYLVIPNKENIYREMLPDYIEIKSNKSRFDGIVDRLRDGGVNVIYLKDKLLDAKETGQLYYAQDTHWNDYGAYVGFNVIMKSVEPSFKLPNAEVAFNKIQIDRDLTGPIGLYGYYIDNIPTVEYLPDNSYTTIIKDDAKIVTENNGAPIQKTIMIVGDSYRQNLPQFFAKTYRKTVFVDRRKYKPEMIDEFKPDTFIALFVERYAGSMCEFTPVR